MCRKGREWVFSEGRLVSFELRVKGNGPSVVPDGRWGPATLSLGRFAELPPSSRKCGTSGDMPQGWQVGPATHSLGRLAELRRV